MPCFMESAACGEHDIDFPPPPLQRDMPLILLRAGDEQKCHDCHVDGADGQPAILSSAILPFIFKHYVTFLGQLHIIWPPSLEVYKACCRRAPSPAMGWLDGAFTRYLMHTYRASRHDSFTIAPGRFSAARHTYSWHSRFAARSTMPSLTIRHAATPSRNGNVRFDSSPSLYGARPARARPPPEHVTRARLLQAVKLDAIEPPSRRRRCSKYFGFRHRARGSRHRR